MRAHEARYKRSNKQSNKNTKSGRAKREQSLMVMRNMNMMNKRAINRACGYIRSDSKDAGILTAARKTT
jgi:hypothetical protein